MSMAEEVVSKSLRLICTLRTLTASELASKLKLADNDVNLVLSALISEGLLVAVDTGTQCLCNACLLRAMCRVRSQWSESFVTNVKYYKLSEAGLKMCGELLSRPRAEQ